MKLTAKLKLKKVLAMLSLAAIAIVGPVTPLLANQTEGQAQTPQISMWAIGDLNEGENYGIFPITWYYEDFQNPISEAKLKLLVENVSEKLKALNIPEHKAFQPEKVGDKRTKEDVIKLLYNEIGKYDIATKAGLNNPTAVEYFQKRSIIKGEAGGLGLDKPCTVEQAVVLATKLIEDTYNLNGVGAKGFVWKATKGNNTMYLLGSIHIGDSSMYPLSKKVKDAFKTSDVLIVEANTVGTQQGLNEFMKKAQYTDGTTLKDHVSKETYDKALKVFEKLNLQKEIYEQFKPWSVTNDLNVLLSSDSSSMEGAQQAASLGVDLYFITTAMANNIPIQELEGLKYQAELFDNLSPQLQEANLNAVLDAILAPAPSEEEIKVVQNDTADEVALWQKQWYEGDVAGFTEDYTKAIGSTENEFTKMLLGKRDRDMTDKLAALLDKEGKTTYFVVVGAGHLAVKDMVVDQLKNRGYTVELFQ